VYNRNRYSILTPAHPHRRARRPSCQSRRSLGASLTSRSRTLQVPTRQTRRVLTACMVRQLVACSRNNASCCRWSDLVVCVCVRQVTVSVRATSRSSASLNTSRVCDLRGVPQTRTRTQNTNTHTHTQTRAAGRARRLYTRLCSVPGLHAKPDPNEWPGTFFCLRVALISMPLFGSVWLDAAVIFECRTARQNPTRSGRLLTRAHLVTASSCELARCAAQIGACGRLRGQEAHVRVDSKHAEAWH
jgi:hypothetical protein